MKTALVVIVAVAVLAGGAFVLTKKSNDEPAAPSPTTSSSSNQTEQSDNAPEANTIEMRNLAFTPKKITVKKGTEVTWVNRDSARHDIVPDEPSDDFRASELLGQDQSFSVTFNTVGTYAYHCTPHPFMKGTIEVTE